MDRDKDRDPSRSCFIHYFHLFSGFWLIAFCADGDEQTSSETEAPDAGIESGTVSPANAVTLSEAGPSQSEASGPLWVSPSLPSSPSPSWFEGADNYSKNRFGDQGEVSSSAPVESPTSLTLSNQELSLCETLWGGDPCWTATWPFAPQLAPPANAPQEVPFDWSRYQHDQIRNRLAVFTSNRPRDTDTIDAIIL